LTTSLNEEPSHSTTAIITSHESKRLLNTFKLLVDSEALLLM